MSVIAVLGSSVLKKCNFYKVIRNHGYEILVIDKEYKGEHADYVINVDPAQTEVVISEIAAFREEHDVKAIIAIFEYYSESAAMVAETLGIPNGSNVAAVKRARNKFLTRQYLRDNNIPTPKFFISNNIKKIHEKIAEFELPVIIKPLNSAGSCSIIKINKLDELDEKLNDAIMHRSGMPLNDYMNDTTKEYWLVEEFLDGIEISVESYTFRGETTVVAIHDKYCKIDEPYFLEKTFVTPSPRISNELTNIIIDMNKKVLKAIEYDNGLSHVEYKLTEKGPRVLEINPRVGGGFITESVYKSTGVNMLEVLLDISCGKKPQVEFNKRRNTAFILLTTEEGKIVGASGFEEVEAMEEIEMAEQLIKIGDIVKARQANYVGLLMACDKEIDELVKVLNVAENKIKFQVEKSL